MKNEEMRLSVNFSLRELCKTKTGIENVPNEEQVNNLKRVCGWLEKLRKRWNERYADIGNGGMEEPLIINSGYRSPAVNKAVGGAPTSNHLTGCAVDIRVAGLEQLLRYAVILLDISDESGEDFDELLLERKIRIGNFLVVSEFLRTFAGEMDEMNNNIQDSERLVLRTEGLVKIYGKRTVVNDVSFDVKQGEIVGLLGPNGAGKTTSFYMTTGLIVPNGGHIYLGDEEVTSYPVYKRARAGIGYLAQEASVFRKMSVEDNILSVLQMTGKPRDYQLEKLESLIKEFRLEKVRKNTGDRLSGGERRRTEIARCLAIEPKFIMLDEPFAGVDPIAVEDIQQIVWQLKYRNIGILITDHNVHETLNITDRAYLLFEGRILFKGSPEELAVNPIVKEKYLGSNFVLQKKDFAKLEEQRRQKWMMEEEEQNY